MFRRFRKDASNKPDQLSGNEPALGGRDAELAQSPRLGGAAGLLHTLEALTDEDWQVRMRAVEALGQMSSDQVLTSLAHALRDSSQHVREHAADALGRMGSNDALDILLKALKTNEIPNTVAAAGLAYFPRPEAIEQLILALNNSSQSERQRVINALVRIGSMATPWLNNALRQSNAFVVSGALDALGRIGGQIEDVRERGRYFDVVAPLIERQDYQIRSAAYLAMGRLREPRAISLLTRRWSDNHYYNHTAMQALGEMGEMAIPTILEGLLSENHTRWHNAADALRFVPSDAIASFVAQVTELRSERRRLLLAHIESLNDPAISELQELLLTELAQDVDKHVRVAAIRALGRRRRGSHALVDALSDEHFGVRLEAVRALGGVPSAEGIQALISILCSPERELHAVAADSLRRMHSEEVVSVLIKAIGDSYTTNTRRKAARSLATQHSPRGVAPLLAAIGDRNHNVRAAAARELGKLIRGLQSQDHMVAIGALRGGLASPDLLVRLHAAYNLCWLGDAAGAGTLTRALSDGVPILYLNAQAIRDVLDRID